MTTRRRRWRAITLIELLVILGIIGLLLALLIPAVQAAREAARRSQCVNNLQQLGMAVHAYIGSFGVLPDDHAGSVFGGSGFSAFARLLPMLEQQAMYDQFNFAFGGTISGGGVTSNDPHRTVQACSLAVLVCPSDPVAGPGRLFLGQTARTNYAGSVGYDTQRGAGRESSAAAGAFGLGAGRPNGLADFADGLTATMLMTEWNLSAPDFRDNTPARATFQTEDFALPDEYGGFIEACRGLDPSWAPLGAPRSQAWIEDGLGDSLLTADLPPGSPTCTDLELVAMSTAGSGHSARINVLFGDGHVRSLATSIDQAAWRAISTRAGAEVIDPDSW